MIWLAHYNSEQALEQADKLVKQVPSNLSLQRDQADTWESVGRYCHSLSKRPGITEAKRSELRSQARILFQKSLTLWQDWTQHRLASTYAVVRQGQAAAAVASCNGP